MTPTELKAIRLGLELSASEFGLALGFGGTKAARASMIHQFESGKKAIPKTLKYRLAWYMGKQQWQN